LKIIGKNYNFNVKFNMGEVTAFKNVGEMVDKIIEKTK